MDTASPRIPEAGRRRLSPEARLVSRLRRSGRVAAERLAVLPNVAGVTVGLKRTGGELTDEPALIAYVTQKHDMPRREAVPRSIRIEQVGRLATDVVEMRGPPRSLVARAGDIVWAGDGDMGTACLTFIKSHRGYVATNAHVVANVMHGRIFPPYVMRPAGHAETLLLGNVAYLSRFAPGLNVTEDLAFIETSAGAVAHLGLVGEPAGIARIDSFLSDLGAEYWYSANGMRVRCRRPEPTPGGLAVPILADGMWYPYSGFWKLEVTVGMVAPGHSGAVICRGSGNDISACGILFGGVLPDTAYAFQLQPAFRRAYDRLPA